MMKLKCELCGEEFESGLANLMKHQFEDCKAAYSEAIPGCDWATIIRRPVLKLTVVEDIFTTIETIAEMKKADKELSSKTMWGNDKKRI